MIHAFYTGHFPAVQIVQDTTHVQKRHSFKIVDSVFFFNRRKLFAFKPTTIGILGQNFTIVNEKSTR